MIVNSRVRTRLLLSVALASGLVFCLLSIVNNAFAITQEVGGDSRTCEGGNINYHEDTDFQKCHTDTSGSESPYRYSRWVYYTVDTSNLPVDTSGNAFIPAIGPGAHDNGPRVGDDNGKEGWLQIEPAMSKCIVENKGFWRRGFFTNKTDLMQTRTFSGVTLNAYQDGIGPVGYSGRSSDNIHSSDDIGINTATHRIDAGGITEWYPSSFSLGKQTLGLGGLETDVKNVWAKMETKMINDEEALKLYRQMEGSSASLDFGDYFLDSTDGTDAGDATALFCYSDNSPFDGAVQIGSSSASYSYHSKEHDKSDVKGVIKDGSSVSSSSSTIDLGEVHTQNFTPGHVLMQVKKSDASKSGSTSYESTMTLNGEIKYSYDGTNWATASSAISKTASATVTTTLKPNFTLAEGDNTICIDLKYAEKRSDSSKQNLKACAKVKYEPIVAAIDSTTSLTLNGVKVGDSGADTTKDFNYGEENYGKDKITAKWDYSLYSTGRCVENNFYTTYCNPTISTAESFNVGYKRFGKLYTDTDTQKAILTSTEYKYNPGSTTKTYSLLPGETIKAEDTRQGIKHRSGVRMNGDNATGSKDEESSAGFTATAKNAVCNINGLEFGLNNPVNYGRMTVYKGGTARYYGNGKNSEGAAVWNTNGPLYFRPDEELKIGYDACLGQQIKVDKDSGKSWDAEWTTGNAKLTVGITGSLLDSSHFTSTGNAVSTDSADSRNILAYEVLGKKISSHVGKDYQFYNVNSKPAQIGNLGHSIVSDFGDLSGCPEGGSNCKAHAVLNVPYNYILTPSINEFTESIVTIGDSFKFKASINKSGRINEDVQSPAYPTNIKKTWAKYLTFKLSTGVDYNNLNTVANNIATLDNDQTDNLGGILRANLGGSSIIDMGSGEFTDDEIKNGTTKEIPVNATDADAGYNKLCVAVAVYPADSHNSRDDTIRAGADQSNALMDGPGANAFTRISVSCRTVGKYPTFSTEGNGILSGGNVSGKYTRYKDERDFGSWSEYGLIANEVDKVASGASIAYIDAQSGINAGASYDRAGKKKDQLDSPQTLGNMDKSEIGLRDSTEASVYANQMTEIANNIKSTFFTDPMPVGGPFLVEYPGTHTWVNLNYKDDVWIGDAEAVAINYHRLAGDQVIIYSDKNIMIENKVTNLDAMLVANGKVDTCYRVDDSGNKIDVDQGGDNSQLLNYCHDNLTVNGAVYSKEAIELDRTYGGGSETDLNLREDTLVKRAEIFNFDPRTVKWGYDYDNDNQPLITTYIEELSTRY